MLGIRLRVSHNKDEPPSETRRQFDARKGREERGWDPE
jgi:hypothetical protein